MSRYLCVWTVRCDRGVPRSLVVSVISSYGFIYNICNGDFILIVTTIILTRFITIVMHVNHISQICGSSSQLFLEFPDFCQNLIEKINLVVFLIGKNQGAIFTFHTNRQFSKPTEIENMTNISTHDGNDFEIPVKQFVLKKIQCMSFGI